MNIVIAFHIPISTPPVRAVHFLDNLFKEVFGDQAARIDLGNEITDEVMYAVHKPLMASNAIMSEFFEKLSKVFSAGIEYIPHFTQLPKELTEKGYLNV